MWIWNVIFTDWGTEFLAESLFVTYVALLVSFTDRFLINLGAHVLYRVSLNCMH
jgi:hypothetical protein